MTYQSFTYSFKDNSNCLQLVNVQCKRYITAYQLTVCVVLHRQGQLKIFKIHSQHTLIDTYIITEMTKITKGKSSDTS